MAARGANVCRVHGGSAPQVREAARRRLDQAADVLVQRLLAFALDGDVADNVALQAIRDALDRAGMAPKTEVEVGVKAPWEEMLIDFANVTRAEHAAMRGLAPPAPVDKADEPMEVVDAEVVEDGPEPQPERDGERANATGAPPSFAERAQPPSRELATLEDATADAAAANRAARVVRVRRKR